MMTNLINKFKPEQKLSDERAMELIEHIVNYGRVIPSYHSDKRSDYRNFTDQDVLFILENGTVQSKRYDKKFGTWKYKISGCDIDGEEGTVVTAIINSQSILIVSVF